MSGNGDDLSPDTVTGDAPAQPTTTDPRVEPTPLGGLWETQYILKVYGKPKPKPRPRPR